MSMTSPRYDYLESTVLRILMLSVGSCKNGMALLHIPAPVVVVLTYRSIRWH